jgi:hypothetical protein
MTTINQLSQASAVSGSDRIPIYSGSQQDTRAVSVSQLIDYTRDQLMPSSDETIYSIAVSSGLFTVSINPATVGGSVWAQLAPSTAMSGTLILPDADGRAPGQEILVTTTQAVPSLTINGNGAGVQGAPTSLAANGFFRLAYDNISNNWFRVG